MLTRIMAWLDNLSYQFRYQFWYRILRGWLTPSSSRLVLRALADQCKRVEELERRLDEYGKAWALIHENAEADRQKKVRLTAVPTGDES